MVERTSKQKEADLGRISIARTPERITRSSQNKIIATDNKSINRATNGGAIIKGSKAVNNGAFAAAEKKHGCTWATHTKKQDQKTWKIF